MNDKDQLTQQIVGAKITFDLGVASGTRTSQARQRRQEGGREEDTPAAKKTPFIRRALVISLGLGVGLGIGGFFYYREFVASKAQQLPVQTMSATPETKVGDAVRAVDEPYPLQPLAPAQEASAPNAASAVPTVNIGLPDSTSAGAPAPAPAAAKQTAHPPTGNAPAQQPPAAVILDTAPTIRAAQSAAETKTVEPKEEAAATPKPKTKKAVLVAITPNGKGAVFTNPQTRLPEKFAVGDTLANGEVVKSIEPKSGKVQTDKATYYLE